MSNPIACICGYRGPSVHEGRTAVCPICRTPATQPAAATVPPASVPAKPFAPPPPPTAAPAVAARSPAAKGYRIPCPRGHVLKASEAMLDQQVVCPQCNEIFVLRREDSLEDKKIQKRLQEEREAQQAKVWLKRAILAAVFVVLSFVAMIAISVLR